MSTLRHPLTPHAVDAHAGVHADEVALDAATDGVGAAAVGGLRGEALSVVHTRLRQAGLWNRKWAFEGDEAMFC